MASNTLTKSAGARTRVSWTVEMLKVIEEVEQQRNNETELNEDSHHNNTRDVSQSGRCLNAIVHNKREDSDLFRSLNLDKKLS